MMWTVHFALNILRQLFLPITDSQRYFMGTEGALYRWLNSNMHVSAEMALCLPRSIQNIKLAWEMFSGIEKNNIIWKRDSVDAPQKTLYVPY